MSFLSDYTEKNSNLIPKIDIPCFAWNSQAEQGLLFFKAKSLTLENIAPLFGYNSSYLGKIFRKKMGENFNSYVDHVRIKHSMELLCSSELKVYAIAEKVGYRNVDYFHIKFKKYVGKSPAEYRKEHKTE